MPAGRGEPAELITDLLVGVDSGWVSLISRILIRNVLGCLKMEEVY